MLSVNEYPYNTYTNKSIFGVGLGFLVCNEENSGGVISVVNVGKTSNNSMCANIALIIISILGTGSEILKKSLVYYIHPSIQRIRMLLTPK